MDAGTKERANTNRGLYKLTDHFFRFWYAFAFTNHSELETGDVDGVYEYAIAPSLMSFASFPFEEICRQYVRELQKARVLPFRYEKMGRWFGKTTVRDEGEELKLRIAETEIDVVAVSRQRKEYLIGECKFKNSPFRYAEYLDTLAKLTPQKADALFYYALFSASGFEKKICEAAKQEENLYLYSLEDIVKIL